MLKKSHVYTAVESFNGIVKRSDGREFADLKSATPKNYECVVIGDALNERGRVVAGGRRRNDAVVNQHPTEFAIIDPRKARIIDRFREEVPAGAVPVGSYGDLFVM